MAVVLLLEHRELLRRQNATHLIAQFAHRGGIERAPSGMDARERIGQRFNLLPLTGREAERCKPAHVPSVENLRRLCDPRRAGLLVRLWWRLRRGYLCVRGTGRGDRQYDYRDRQKRACVHRPALRVRHGPILRATMKARLKRDATPLPDRRVTSRSRLAACAPARRSHDRRPR